MKWIGPILGVVGPIIGSLVGASPFGAIVLGVAGLALGGLAFFAYAKFKAWQFNEAHKKEQAQAAKDEQSVIQNNQSQSVGDAATIEQGEKDKQAAINELKGKK